MFEIEIMVKSMMEEPICLVLNEIGIEGCAIYNTSEPLSEDELWDDMDVSLPEGMCRVVGYIDSNHIENEIQQIKDKIEEFKTYGIDFEDYGIDVREIMDIDWAEEHKKYYQVMYLDDIVICPTWDVRAIERHQGKKLVILEPGAAFGTGLHESTKLCMKFLNKYVNEDDCVYDIGCGSGILSILASRLGARKVVASDIDEIAVSAAKKNAALNQLNNIEVKQENLLKACSHKADIMVANIIASILKKIIPQAKRFIKKGGLFILSGILDTQENEVKECLLENNYIIKEIMQQGEWISIAAINEEE
jgi:ribosomal protein L11 methyltransferase